MTIGDRRPIKTLSLFTGAGGLDLGFHAAGYDIVACVEIESKYCRTLEANKGPGRFFSAATQILCEDVRKLQHLKLAGQRIECIIGGPPCQTFSAAGRRSGGVLGTSDARGRLFRAYCKILQVLEPSVFVFENVYGLPGANRGQPWRDIVRGFSALGYRIKAEVLDAADFGVPQHRERLIMVGHRNGEFELPLPTHGPDSPTKRPLVSVREAITDLQDPTEQDHDDLGGLYGHLLAAVPPGLNYAYFTREMGYPEPIFAWRSKFHDFLYKVDPAQPCRTIKARPGKFTGPFHWKNRHFTVQELKRLQAIPDAYELVGNYGKVVEQIGNSVPPLLAEVIAVSVREQLIDRVAQPTYPIRPHRFAATFRQRQRERTAHFRATATSSIIARFGGGAHDRGQRPAEVEQSHYVHYQGFFQKTISSCRPRKVHQGRAFKSTVAITGAEIDLVLDRVGGGRPTRRIKIELDGLQKGLTNVTRLTANSSVPEACDIFYLWSSIEEALVQRSQFLTLIDIYGHYANRGDAVSVETDIIGGAATSVVRAIRFFGSSSHCGAPLSRAAVQSSLGVDVEELDKVIAAMRAMRFDVRTKRTHPTMSKGMVLCTYPFPLLSRKAHLERRRAPGALISPSDAQDQLSLF